MLALEDSMVRSIGGTISSEGGIMTLGRQHVSEGGSIPTDARHFDFPGGMMLLEGTF